MTSMRLLVGGALLLVIWIVSPASSSPSPQTATDAPAPRRDQPFAGLIEVNEQVERLSQRVAPDVARPAPSRNPFDFGRIASVAPPTVSAAAVAPVVMPPAPRLVAILTDTNDTAVPRSVVLAEGDAVEILKAGDRFGAFTIGAIGEERVELVDAGSGASVTLSLR